jgi:ABC-2 type transport system permease protein
VNRSRVAALVLRQIYLYRGSPQRILPIFAWVVVDIVLWGFITRYLNSVSGAGFDFVPTLLGAVLLWDFLTRVMQGVSMAFFEDVWSRNFLNFFATPLRTSEYLAGLIVTGVSTSLVGLAVMLFVAWAVFGLSFLTYGAALVPFLFVLFLSGIAFGVAGAALVLRLGPASEWLIWPIPTLVSPFAGVFYPVSILPGWMQAIARLLPPSYVFDGMRAVVAGQPLSWAGLGIGCVLAVAYVILAWLLFAAVYRYSIRTGLIARYSAETVS